MKRLLAGDDARPVWRPLRRADLPAVVDLADLLHPDARERAEVFEEKWRLFPGGCFGLEQNGALLGYAISHPWRENEIPPLDAFLGELPKSPNCLFLHDIAIAVEGRGHASAAALVDRLMGIARDEKLPLLALVAMYGSDRFWRRLEFDPGGDNALDGQLEKYGARAIYMKRRV